MQFSGRSCADSVPAEVYRSQTFPSDVASCGGPVLRRAEGHAEALCHAETVDLESQEFPTALHPSKRVESSAGEAAASSGATVSYYNVASSMEFPLAIGQKDFQDGPLDMSAGCCTQGSNLDVGVSGRNTAPINAEHPTSCRTYTECQHVSCINSCVNHRQLRHGHANVMQLPYNM